MIVETTRALVRLFKTVEQNTHLSAGSIVELAKLPAIVLDGPTLTENPRLAKDAYRLRVIDEEELTATYEMPPRWYDLRFSVNFAAKSALAIAEMIEKCSRLVQASPLLTAENNERTRQYSWRWVTPLGMNSSPNVSEVYEGRGELVVSDVEVYSGVREVWPLIRSVEIEFNTPRKIDSVIVREELNEEHGEEER